MDDMALVRIEGMVDLDWVHGVHGWLVGIEGVWLNLCLSAERNLVEVGWKMYEYLGMYVCMYIPGK